MSKIEVPDAIRLHRNFVNNLSDEARDIATRAVLISIKEATKEKLGDEKNAQILDFFKLIQFDTLVCYMGRYDNNDGEDKMGKNTVVVHLANTNDDGSVTVIENQLYNFGNLKPPKRPIGEQVVITS